MSCNTFWRSIADGVLHTSFLTFMWYRATLRYPSCTGRIAPQVRLLGEGHGTPPLHFDTRNPNVRDMIVLLRWSRGGARNGITEHIHMSFPNATASSPAFLDGPFLPFARPKLPHPNLRNLQKVHASPCHVQRIQILCFKTRKMALSGSCFTIGQNPAGLS